MAASHRAIRAGPTSTPTPGRPEHFVAAEGDEVGAQRLHVERQMRHALGRVDQHDRPGGMARRTISSTGLIVPSTFDTAVTATILVRLVSRSIEMHPVANGHRR